MTYNGKSSEYVSPAMVTGLVAVTLAPILSLFNGGLAVIPLVAYVFICVMAPFFPSRGFFLPVNSRGHTGKSLVSLTFDDGPDPVTTRPLLQLLKQHAIEATFFVIGERAAKYGDLISDILAQGHDIGNHSYSHDPLLMLRRSEKLHREIAETQIILKCFGVVPTAFRPPVGITNPRLPHVLRRHGLRCVNFTCRAFDGGNRRILGLSARILKKVSPDDIIVLHDIRPKGAIDTDGFLSEIDLILSGLKKKGLQIVPLAELLGEPVMIRIDNERC